MAFAQNKRIIICVDGTWQSSNSGEDAGPSNVSKIAEAIATTGQNEKGESIHQIVYYMPGLGSSDLLVQKMLYGAFGWGLDYDVCRAYHFICNNYVSGDELFFFGFSRGAFTVRSVASLICEVGILSRNFNANFGGMWDAYRQNNSINSFNKTDWYVTNRKELLQNVPVKVVGVWDTVGALGIPNGYVNSALSIVGLQPNDRYNFHNTNLSDNVENAFQALALDERRGTFPPTIWKKTKDKDNNAAKDEDKDKNANLQQCWFPGTHVNIGGQAVTPANKGDGGIIGYNTLAWMVDAVSPMLTFDQDAITEILRKYKLIRVSHNYEWGCGPIKDNYDYIGGMLAASVTAKPRTPNVYFEKDKQYAQLPANEVFHPMVRYRYQKQPGWRPKSLEGYSDNLSTRNGDTMPEDIVVPNGYKKNTGLKLAYYEDKVLRFKLENTTLSEKLRYSTSTSP